MLTVIVMEWESEPLVPAHKRCFQVEPEERHFRLLRPKLRARKYHETPRLQARGGHGGTQQPTNGNRMDGQKQRPRLQGRSRSDQNLLSEPAAATRPGQTGEDGTNSSRS